MSEDELIRTSFEQVSFPELIMRLHDEGVTGVLSVKRERVEKSVYFEQGRLVFARSSNPDDRLGEILLRQGVISVAQYRESSARIAPGRRQGAILCEMEAIAAEELVRHVTDQVIHILHSLFLWPRAECEIRLGELDPGDRVMLSIAIEDVVLGGIRQAADWQPYLAWPRGIHAAGLRGEPGQRDAGASRQSQR